jgi:tetratricopeptide (TPR) repeat protein
MMDNAACIYALHSRAFEKQGRLNDSLSSLKRGYDLASKLGENGDLALMAHYKQRLAYCYSLQGKFNLAVLEGQEGLAISHLNGHLYSEALIHEVTADALIALGDYRAAEEHCTAGAALYVTLGLNTNDSDMYRNLVLSMAENNLQRTQYTDARNCYALLGASLAGSWTPHNRQESLALCNLVYIEAISRERCDPSLTERLGAVRARLTTSLELTFSNCCESEILYRCKKYSEAQKPLLSAITGARGTQAASLGIAYQQMGDVQFAQQRILLGLEYYILYLSLAKSTNHRLSTHQALRRLGDIFQAFDDPDTARSLWQVALDGFLLMGIHRDQGDCWIRLGDLELKQGNVEVARRFWEDAKTAYKRCPVEREVRFCVERLALNDSSKLE